MEFGVRRQSEASAALQHGDASLKPKAAYDLALATESMGQAEEAVRRYAAALGEGPLRRRVA